jgi:timeless protein
MGVWDDVQEDKLTEDECESMNSCLLLLRNILHIPESHVVSPIGSGHCSKQNQILWNLFTQSVDKILVQLMTCPQKVKCTSNTLRTIYLLFV